MAIDSSTSQFGGTLGPIFDVLRVDFTTLCKLFELTVESLGNSR